MKKLLFYFLAFFISAGLFADPDVLPPTLVSPENGDENQMPDVLMDWYAVAGIGTITYELQYDTDSLFSNPVSVETEFTSAQGVELFFGSTYYWRVRAMDDTGTGDWSDVKHFSTFAQLVLDSPSDGATKITPETDLKWKSKIVNSGDVISGITFYDYQLAYDTTFTNIFVSGSKTYVYSTSSILHTVSLMLFDTTYYWRVRARHGADTCDWSVRRSFTTTASCENVSPADGATGQMLDVTIEWKDMRGSYEYIYELCDDPTFETPCIFYTDENKVTAMGLLFGTSYYWRVKAAHTADTSDWSETWDFETLSTVALTSPENGGFVDDYFPTLTWQALTGVTGFQLQYDVDQAFSAPNEEMVDGSKNSYKVLFSLEMDQTYFWRVRAYENGDTTSWSEVWSFTIGTQGVDELLTERTVSIYPNPAKTEMFIEVNSLKQNEVEVDVVNLLGQTVIREMFDLNLGINKKQINVKDLEGGLYIIQMKSGDESFMKKLVIEK